MKKAKKTIGMLVAVEIGAVLSRYGDKLTDVSETGFDVKRLDSDDYTMYILKSGAGEIAAAAGTQFLITKYGAEFIINFGVVGGLTPEMSLAKTCVVESVVHYDFDTSTIDNCEVGRYLEYPSIYIPAPSELVDAAIAAEPSLKRVICASGDKFVDEEARPACRFQCRHMRNGGRRDTAHLQPQPRTLPYDKGRERCHRGRLRRIHRPGGPLRRHLP